jgi:hypothetical protein
MLPCGSLPVTSHRIPRAPQDDGAVVAVPALEDVPELVENNRLLFANREWSDRRRAARADVLAAAADYLRANGEPLPEPLVSESLFFAGHQPELFHPGVWVKNFALAGLARRCRATPINLLVDNDTVKTTALRMPVPPAPGVEPWTHLTSVAFDHPPGEIPWEEYTLQEPALFDNFADRVRPILQGWGYEPLLSSFWPDVRRHVARSPLVGACFAAARRALERRWGCHNLEVPLSVLCCTPTFAGFAASLVAELPRFHAVYNDCVHAYRKANHIRSRNHPVPDLAIDGDWLEAPLWGWHVGQKRRQRLFARRGADRIELRCGNEPWPALPLPEARLAAEWPALEADGRKVRTRALTTTLFARLYLADLFIHGIGGGKYDELNDEILRRFHGIEPPDFLVLSATKWLPVPSFPVTVEDHRRTARQLRDLHWNPQRHIEDLLADDELVASKADLIAYTPLERDRKAHFQVLRSVTEKLRGAVKDDIEAVRVRLEQIDRQLDANAILRRRDYAFCLYPESALRPLCERFVPLFD